MGWINEAWLRDAFEALEQTLKVDSRLKREMIQFLFDEGFWDEKKLGWQAAEARFNACLNPAKSDAFFKLGEAWALMKRFNRHQFFLAMADDLGYEVRRKPTEERRQELLERIAVVTESCARQLEASNAELARLGDPAHDPRPAALPGAPRPAFSKDGASREGVP